MANGIPPLPPSAVIGIGIATVLTNDVVFGFGGLGSSIWGIFLGVTPVIRADTVVSLEYRQNWRISDYPVEQGSFESYDKVATPYLARVRMARGGSVADRKSFLDSIAAIAGDLNLYNIVTPEEVFVNANVESYSLVRTAQRGLGLLTVDIVLTEVRVTTSTQFSSAQQPSGAAQQNGGTVQTQTPTTNQVNLVGQGLG